MRYVIYYWHIGAQCWMFWNDYYTKEAQWDALVTLRHIWPRRKYRLTTEGE